MTAGADRFRDRNHRYGTLVACADARRVLADPGAPAAGMAHSERFARDHRPQRCGSRCRIGAGAVADRLTERSESGDRARETARSFGGLPGPTRGSLLRRGARDIGESGGSIAGR